MADACAEVLDDLESGKAAMIPTGFDEFDREFGGIPAGCVVTMMGTPSSGKTTLCLQILRNMARRGVRSLIFSNEQGAKRIAATLLTMESGVQVHDRMGRGQATRDEREKIAAAALEIAGLPIEQMPHSMHAGQIYAQAKFAKQRGVELIYIDYLQHLPWLPGCNSETERIGESMKMLARIARDMGLTVLIVSQIDKATSKASAIAGEAKRRPTMFDGIGSSAIEQASDWIYSVFRPHMHDPLGDDPDQWRYEQSMTEWSVLKAKFVTRGSHALRFDPGAMEFRE